MPFSPVPKPMDPTENVTEESKLSYSLFLITTHDVGHDAALSIITIFSNATQYSFSHDFRKFTIIISSKLILQILFEGVKLGRHFELIQEIINVECLIIQR